MIWPLNKNNFSTLDRIKICSFVLGPNNRWTQSKQVIEFEKNISNYVDSKYAVFVSSGSAANTLLSLYSMKTEKKIVVLPSTTWQTSCSPWILNGFTPHFIDISLEDFSIDKNKLLSYVKENSENIACVFPTSVIGMTPDIDFYKDLEKKYSVRVMFDNCENTLGEYEDKNISSYFTSTTSTYFGHQIQSIEGGFIFTDSEEEHKFFLMSRNHGMTRSLKPYGYSAEDIENDQVDSLFDFNILGGNYRNTDLNAFIGRLDLKRANFYKKKRIELYKVFKTNLCSRRYYLPEPRENCLDVPFCLPIICKNKDNLQKVKLLCVDNNIEYRPIISGFLGYQTCYKNFFDYNQDYSNSIMLNDCGMYIGLYHSIGKDKIIDFVNEINAI